MQSQRSRVTIREVFGPAAVAVGMMLAFSPALAVPDVEFNDTFLTRNSFVAGTTSIEGSLTQPIAGAVIATFNDTLNIGSIDTFNLVGLTSGNRFVAETSSLSNIDTLLGVFSDNTFSNLIGFNDDFSGLSSRVNGFVNSSGEINVAVTGIGDDNFIGDHAIDDENYTLTIFEAVGGDLVDFLSFTGLLPGSTFVAEIDSSDFDTVLGLFDGAGSLIETDDDGGVGLLSRLEGTVGASGIVNLAVSGFDDFSFAGVQPEEEGDYVLLFSTTASVPEPGTLALFGIGLLGLGALRRRRKSA